MKLTPIRMMIIADFGAEIEMPVFYACFREKRSGIHDSAS